MQAVAFTTRQYTTFLLLVSPCEVKSTEVRTCVDLTTTHTDILRTVCNHFKHTLVRVNIGVYLVHITHAYSLTHSEGALVSLLHTHNHAEESRLTCTVRTDDTHDAVRWQHKFQVLKQQLLAKSLAHALCVDNLVTQTWTVRDKDL